MNSILGRWKTALGAKILPNQDPGGVVHVQNLDRHFAGKGFSKYETAMPSEMTLPDLPARMIQWNESS